jgi:hypothetical protein
MKVSYSLDYDHVLTIDNFKFIGKTNGKGWWSNELRRIACTSAELYLLDDSDDGKLNFDFGELRVYFNNKSWDIKTHGLIYTDPAWLKDLRAYLLSIGFTSAAVKSVDYSEQGMQGNDYVSLDTGKSFNKIILDHLPLKIQKKIKYK